MYFTSFNYSSMILFLDTETTGLPLNWSAPINQVSNWPRLVQLACLLYDEEGNLLEERSHIIRPEGYTIPAASVKIHRISTERALDEGQNLSVVLDEFKLLLERTSLLVAHNINFDHAILGAEYYRKIQQDPLLPLRKFCTMTSPEVITHCALPANSPRGGYKWPKLEELHYKLFKQELKGAHDALVDIQATARCYWELRRLGVI